MHVEKQGQRFVGVSFIGFCASIVALVDFLLGHGADRGVAGIALVICFLLWVAEPNRRPQTASTGSIGIWQLAGLIGRRNRSVEVAGLTTCEFLDAGTAFGWGKTGDGHVGVGLVRAVGRRGPTGDPGPLMPCEKLLAIDVPAAVTEAALGTPSRMAVRTAGLTAADETSRFHGRH
jgi:hypothetical protein